MNTSLTNWTPSVRMPIGLLMTCRAASAWRRFSATFRFAVWNGFASQAASDATMTKSIIIFAARLSMVDLQNMARSDEHTSELQSLMRISYAVFCLNKHKYTLITHN